MASVPYELEEEPLPEVPPSHIQTAYGTYYAVDVGGVEGNDQFLYVHPNGLCVVGVAPGHAALAGAGRPQQSQEPCAPSAPSEEPSNVVADGRDAAGGEAAGGESREAGSGAAAAGGAAAGGAAAAAELRLSFEGIDGLEASTSSKKPVKNRSPPLKPDTPLCSLSWEGRRFTLVTRARGQLVELNRQLEQLSGPALQTALQDRYVAILSISDKEQAALQALPAGILSSAAYAALRGLPSSMVH